MSEFGLGIFALGEIQRAETAAARQSGSGEIAGASSLSGYIFRAKGQVHGLRSSLYGHRVVEDMLISALKAENANHPLASRDAVDAAVVDARAKALLNPEVIKRTYPDGKLPNGVIVPPDLTVRAVA